MDFQGAAGARTPNESVAMTAACPLAVQEVRRVRSQGEEDPARASPPASQGRPRPRQLGWEAHQSIRCLQPHVLFSSARLAVSPPLVMRSLPLSTGFKTHLNPGRRHQDL